MILLLALAGTGALALTREAYVTYLAVFAALVVGLAVLSLGSVTPAAGPGGRARDAGTTS